jgi:hypothetical protein
MSGCYQRYRYKIPTGPGKRKGVAHKQELLIFLRKLGVIYHLSNAFESLDGKTYNISMILNSERYGFYNHSET